MAHGGNFSSLYRWMCLFCKATVMWHKEWSRLLITPPPVSSHSSIQRHTHTHTHTHIQTQGLGFRSEATDYNMFITLQPNCRALIKHAHTNLVFALLVNCGVLIKNWSASCCVSLLRRGIHYLFAMHRCIPHARSYAHTQIHTRSVSARHACKQSQPVE